VFFRKFHLWIAPTHVNTTLFLWFFTLKYFGAVNNSYVVNAKTRDVVLTKKRVNAPKNLNIFKQLQTHFKARH